jgi:hypothetical protein
MKEYLLNTRKEPCAIHVVITTAGSGMPFYLIGYDAFTPKTFFFQSRFLISGREEITMNCPQSPRNMKVVMWADGGIDFYVHKLEILPLSVPQDKPEWVQFLERFSRYCGMLWPGRFQADNVPFEIDYRRHIITDSGHEHTTPARISVDEPVIQVSKNKFDAMSIPQRMVILLHEVSHNFINNNPDSEMESDDNGLLIYKDLGYPKIEAINAFSEIMSDTDNNVRRMMNLINI